MSRPMTPRELATQARRILDAQKCIDPGERFRRMVADGLIDRDGRLLGHGVDVMERLAAYASEQVPCEHCNGTGTVRRVVKEPTGEGKSDR